MKKLCALALIFVFISCNSDAKKEEKITDKKTAKITIEFVNYDGLALLLNKKDHKTYVINFWATWCKPCVEELPAFQKLYETHKSKNVEVILVSLDFKNQVETRLIPFIKEHNIQPKVVLMVDSDQNMWIPKVNPEWSGAVPATVIYNKKDRAFFEQSFTYEKLESELIKILNTN